VIGPPAGWVVTCNACGRRELFERKTEPEPAQPDLLSHAIPTGEL